jgi:YVTN family beta-propeller protein
MRQTNLLRIVGQIAGFLLLVMCAALPSRAQTETFLGPFAYVTNQAGNSVSVIDTPTNTVVTTIGLPGCDGTCPSPAGLVVTPDGSRVYVANSNGTVSVITTSNNMVFTTISVPPICDGCSASPVGVAITPDGTRAYVTDPGQEAIEVIDTNPSDGTYNTVTATITADAVISPFSIAVTPNGAYVYATEFSPDSDSPTPTTNVNMISTATNAVVATIGVGNDPSGVAVIPNGSSVYVTNNASGTVSVFAAGIVTDTPAITTIAMGVAGVAPGPYSVAFTPNSAFAYVVNQFASNVAVINTATTPPTVAATVSGVGTTPNQIAIAPNGTTAYAAVGGNNDVAVINTATNVLQTPIGVGSGPFGVAIGPATNTVTVGPFAVSPGTTVNFIDGSFINQKITIPPDANMGGVATMQMSFIQVSPAVFNATRLTGVLGNTFSGGNQGPFTSPPTTCTVITGTVNNSNCVVMEAKCFRSDGTALLTCDITAPTTLITLTTSYETPFPQPTPGFLIADDNANNWANILIGYNATAFNVNDPIMVGGTKSCQEDTVIVNLGGPVTPSPASVNLGNVPVFGFPISVVTVTNTGTAAVTIKSKLAAVPGGDSDDFGALSLCLKPLQPTKSCFILVSFFADPDDFNLQTATLNITNSASGSPQLIVPLTATVVLPKKK